MGNGKEDEPMDVVLQYEDGDIDIVVKGVIEK